MAITIKNAKRVWETVESEGFDYAFRHYSNFPEIEDDEFHKLRQDYINAANALSEYCGLDEES